MDGEGSTARRQMELLGSRWQEPVSRRDLLPRERAALGAGTAGDHGAGHRADCADGRGRPCSNPTAGAAASLRTSRSELLEDGHDVALELRRLVHGDLCGMFDGPTTEGLDLSSPLVILDLSALYSSSALGVLMACATAWLQAASGSRRGGKSGAGRRADLRGHRRGLGPAVQPGGGALAPGVVEAVQGIRRRQRGHFASGDGPALGRSL